MLKRIRSSCAAETSTTDNTLALYSKIRESKQNLGKPTKLVWNILAESGFGQNARLGYINVFEFNWPFRAYLYKAYREFNKDFNEFSKAVCSAVSHEYWARCEYEIIISPWPTRLDETEIKRLQAEIDVSKAEHPEYKNHAVYPDLVNAEKIDVADQIMMNWDAFISYLWANRKLLSKFKSDYCELFHKKNWYPPKTTKKTK